MNRQPDNIQTIYDGHRPSTVLNYRFSPGKIRTSRTSVFEPTTKLEKFFYRDDTENEILRYCQALLLSSCMLALSYYGFCYGRTEYSIMENGQVVQGYKHKAIVTLSLGYSVPYSMVSFLAIGMLVYSLLSKSPRWSLPSIILYLADLAYDISGAVIAIWLFFFNFPLSIALSYTIGTVLFILGEIWIWLGVLRFYEYRRFK